MGYKIINILHNRYTIDDSWCFSKFKEYIKPEQRVVVIAFSFKDEKIKSLIDWNSLYNKKDGIYYLGIVNAFKSYGIKEENINFINYFADSIMDAKEKVKQADILYFLGGLPDRMYDRVLEFDLVEDIKKHKGIVMGYSAGAMIQLSEYHISPDDDYPIFTYKNGLGLISDFGIEVHYESTDIQKECIKRYIREKKRPVYAIGDSGALIVDGAYIQMIGDVEYYDVCRYINEDNNKGL